MMLLVALALAPNNALAGYADVDTDGYPSWEDRDTHLWTNAARVDPEAFESDYNDGGCSYYEDFSEDEQTPKAPLFYDRDLNEAAVYHSDDMNESGNFSHDSSDGTSFADRVGQYYNESGNIGENIAVGYGSGFNSVFIGWMCSHSGHRANIMSGSYNELGTGVSDGYYTQDFAAGTVDTDSAVAMGIHSPQAPSDEVSFYADWVDDAAPARFEVIIDGQPSALELEWGAEDQGVYALTLAADGDGCHEYFFQYDRADGSTGAFPETGSYLYGSGCEGDVDWKDRQMGVTGRDDADRATLLSRLHLVGCATSPGVAGPGAAGLLGVAMSLAAVAGRRRT